MVHLCIYCNHFADYSQILDLKNLEGLPIAIHPLDFSCPHVLKQQMVLEKHGYPFLLGIHQTIPFTKDHLLYLKHLCGLPIPLRTPIPMKTLDVLQVILLSQTSRFQIYSHVRCFIHLLICTPIFFHIKMHVLPFGFLIHLPLQILNHYPIHIIV